MHADYLGLNGKNKSVLILNLKFHLRYQHLNFVCLTSSGDHLNSMIKPKERLFITWGDCTDQGPYIWTFADFDQRKHFKVTYNPEAPDHKDNDGCARICQKQLEKYIDDLDKEIVAIRFSDPDGDISVSTALEEDMTEYGNNHPLPTFGFSMPVETISVEDLTELDRLGPQVDLVSYQGRSVGGAKYFKKAIFKYWWLLNDMHRPWEEAGCWARLPRDHPHIVSFDKMVLEPIDHKPIGFTTQFIKGGTLSNKGTTTRPFRLQWFRQLLAVVDDLNYTYGIMHQNITPRNLIIDEQDNLRILNFDCAWMIRQLNHRPEQDDLAGVMLTLYELITLDSSLRRSLHTEQDIEALLRQDWAKHPSVQLDREVCDFRNLLGEWAEERKRRLFARRGTWIRWEGMPDCSLTPRILPIPEDFESITRIEPRDSSVWRQTLVELQIPFWEWERPASYSLWGALENDHTADDEDEIADGVNFRCEPM